MCRFGFKEEPFYVHLEPDPIDVLTKKKKDQKEMKYALEEQVQH